SQRYRTRRDRAVLPLWRRSLQRQKRLQCQGSYRTYGVSYFILPIFTEGVGKYVAFTSHLRTLDYWDLRLKIYFTCQDLMNGTSVCDMREYGTMFFWKWRIKDDFP